MNQTTRTRKHKGGRPTIVTQDVLNKLEEVFALGGTDKEACLFAGISHMTLYNYQERYPEFVERKETLKQSPVLKARRTINNALEFDTGTARWYVEKRDKDFSNRQELDVTTQGEKITGTTNIQDIANEAARILKEQKT